MMTTRNLLTSAALTLGALALTAVPANADSLSPRSTIASQADADENLMQQLGQLAKAVDSVQWQGAAATAFQSLMQANGQDAEKVNKALEEIAEQVAGGVHPDAER
ncbi:WXG100 family type VII secretion target [Streptomyces sp. NPDC012888]|uniref:WXG100 family type VII secretion target n=1 Tax=Streptomyces sp. NPDC012888 TaxID=3364855 RepID=UPI00368701BD